MSKMLRSSSVLGPPGPPTELDHGLIAVAKGEARQLTSASVAIEETHVPALAKRERHQDFVHESGSFPWKLGLEGEILPRRKGDEPCPDAPATNPRFELFPLVDTDLETAQELTYFIQGRVSEVATERRAQINFQKLNEAQVAVVTRVEIDAMRHTTLCAKPLSHRVRWIQRNTAKAANLTLLAVGLDREEQEIVTFQA